MNLRILKKLSKRAAPILMAMAEIRTGFSDVAGLQHYPADPGEGFSDISSGGFDHKHWDRSVSAHRDMWRDRDILLEPSCRTGTRYPYIKVTEPTTCWRGTAMVGWMSGYEEPEWEQRTAWEYLENLVRNSTMDIVQDPEGDGEDIPDFDWIQTVRHPNPAAILRFARGMLGGE